MKGSGSSLLKSFANKIHPPLSLTPRESQKLLGLLNDSFRRKLDQEHGDIRSMNATLTDAHVHSVLSSPLFKSPSTNQKINTRNQQGTSHYVGEIQESLVAPMDYFQEQVAAGQATLEIATRCLKVQKQNKTLYQDMMSSKIRKNGAVAAQPVLHWLWASGFEDSMEFVYHHGFLRELLPFMVAENKDARVWSWLSKIQAAPVRSNCIDPMLLASSGMLLSYFVSNLVTVRGSINDAIEAFSQFSSNIEKIPQFQFETMLRRPINMLISLIMRENPKSIKGSSYDELESTLRRLHLDRFSTRAGLCLCHPSKPNASTALAFIRALKPETLSNMSLSQSDNFILLCLKTKEVLSSAGRKSDAKEVMKIFQKKSNILTQTHPKYSTGRSQEEKGSDGQGENTEVFAI